MILQCVFAYFLMLITRFFKLIANKKKLPKKNHNCNLNRSTVNRFPLIFVVSFNKNESTEKQLPSILTSLLVVRPRLALLPPLRFWRGTVPCKFVPFEKYFLPNSSTTTMMNRIRISNGIEPPPPQQQQQQRASSDLMTCLIDRTHLSGTPKI